MKTRHLYLMMGAPGSGKSTWIKAHLNPQDVYVSRDEIRFAKLKDGEDYFAHEGNVYAEFIEKIVDGLLDDTKGKVIADASHLNAGSRGKTIRAIYTELKNRETAVDFDVNVIWLKTSLETCLKRNALRSGRANVPDETIEDMWKSQRMPKVEEGISKVYVIQEDGKIQVIDYYDDDGLVF